MRINNIFFLVLWSLILPSQAHGQAAAAFSSILNDYSIQPDVWRPAKPIEPGVDSRGDLHLSLPIMTVPGRNGLNYSIQFGYRSGITVTQQSSWIGLGWFFDPGSIVRDVQGIIVGGEASGHYNVD